MGGGIDFTELWGGKFHSLVKLQVADNKPGPQHEHEHGYCVKLLKLQN